MRFTVALLWLLVTVREPVDHVALPFRHQNSPTASKYLIETMGGGVALLDYNNDGLLDIFLVNSGYLPRDGSVPKSFDRKNPLYWNRLYRQNRDGTYTDVTKEAGLANEADQNYGMGVAVADYNNDGFPDLYVTNYGHNVLYRNNGNGTFTDVTREAGVGAGGWSVSAGFFDFDNDGLLDLFVTRYLDWNLQTSKVCPRDTYCPAIQFPPVTNILYRNIGGGKFEDVTLRSGIGEKKGRALGVAFNDYDGDGFPDVFVANDGMEQFLYHNNGNGTFEERALEAGVALSDDGQPFAGMGVDFRDYDNDGRPDVIVTNLARQVYALYHNDGRGMFSYRSRESGIAALSSGSSGWGLRWEDFDNDGWKDLLVAQGHVMDNVEFIDSALHYRERPLFALNHHGRFERAELAVGRDAVAGRGAAFGDLDNDGQVDAVLGILGSSPVILQNPAGSAAHGNHWLTIRQQKFEPEGVSAASNQSRSMEITP